MPFVNFDVCLNALVGLPYFLRQKGGHLFNEIYQQLVVLHRLYGKRQTKASIILAISQSVTTFNFST